MLGNNYINNLLASDIDNLLDEINSLSKEKKKLVLSNEKVKNRIINSYYYLFANFVESLDKELLDIFLDKQGIDLLVNSNEFYSKINALINLENEMANDILTDDKILKQMYEHYDESNFCPKNIFFVQKFFDYLIANNLGLGAISYWGDNLAEILKRQENIDKIIQNKSIDIDDLDLYDTKIIEVMLENSYFKNLILDDKYDISKLIFKGVSFSEEVLSDKRFIEKLVNEGDIRKYRFMMDSLYKNNNLLYLSDIKNKRNVYYDNIINSYDKDLGMFKEYADIFNSLVVDGKLVDQQIFFDLDLEANLDDELCYDINAAFFNRKLDDFDKITALKVVFMRSTCFKFKEILVDRYYEDIIYNFKLDLENLIKFNNEQKVINDQNMEHYLRLLKILNSDSIVDIDFYNSFDRNKNYIEEYYDDFYASRQKSYSLINNSLVDIENIKNQKNEELSSLYGTDIYEFNGEPFYLLIHDTSVVKSNVQNIDGIFENPKWDSTSMSLISNLKMSFFHDSSDMLVVGFNNLDVDRVVHIYNMDSNSYYNKESGIATNKLNKLYTPASLIEDTRGYNEIIYRIKRNNPWYLSKTLKLSYVVAFDKVTPIDIEFSKKFHIPIIKINREKYKNHENYKCETSENFDLLDLYSDKYVASYYELIDKIDKKR